MLILDINNNAIACPKVSVDACEIADCLKPRASEICPDVCTQGEYRLVIIICNCDYSDLVRIESFQAVRRRKKRKDWRLQQKFSPS